MTKFSVQSNFLDKQLFTDIKIDLDSRKTQKVWASNKFVFNPDVTVDPDLNGTIHVCRISDDIRERVVDFLVQSETLSDIGIKKENIDTENMMYYCADTNSGIDWHTDSFKKVAISLYLNDNWDPEWGGVFCYRDLDDGETVHQVVPESNKAVILQGPVWHSVTKLQPEAPLRESLQIFVNLDK